jgi:hypothetical protein
MSFIVGVVVFTAGTWRRSPPRSRRCLARDLACVRDLAIRNLHRRGGIALLIRTSDMIVVCCSYPRYVAGGSVVTLVPIEALASLYAAYLLV